jgi:hypothetical protein
MKTSKIIFISFFSIIGLFLLSFLIQVKPNKQQRPISELESKTVSLSSFSHLVITDGVNLDIEGGESDALIVYPTGKKLSAPNYRVSGDTLIVDSLQEKSFVFLKLIAHEIKTIKQTNGSLVIRQFNATKLSVTGSNCNFSLNNEVVIDSLDLNLSSGSYMDCQRSTSVKVVKAGFDNSKAYFYNDKLDQLDAILNNNSELTANRVLQSNVKTDETSRYFSR